MQAGRVADVNMHVSYGVTPGLTKNADICTRKNG